MSDHFLTARVDIRQAPQITREFSVFWTPTIVTLHPRGYRLRETAGYLPPRELLADLRIARGFLLMRSAKMAEAAALFEGVVRDQGETATAAEAMFWQGFAESRARQDHAVMDDIWRKLVATYPESVWAKKAVFPESGA